MNPYTCQYYYQEPGERYNSKATDSVRHSRIGYWATDPYYDENEYTVGTVRYSDYREYNENVDYNIQYAESAPTRISYEYTGQQPYPHVYYRGNGGDLRVWDRPFDIVAASMGVRGGVAETYTTQYWGASAGTTFMIILAVIVLGIGAYLLGRKTVV
jgi:hypothetical protein